ncbi:helicase-related protein [Clostridium algidicarnis]|uniref:Helicase-like protein n=1 Tax=Clostridium algidicarnis DSM 15099 TaxID=1121295 RepID=A0A2S6FXS0_9CLOT|nr:helicase-related protein [Clostridium algidicarnis]PPK48381.1 helicase-like protein [Clostridium algidicarnis DSM 15099]
MAVGLSRLGKKRGSDTRYFAHHSSVSKDMRLTAEKFAKSSKGELFTICCTSTLELGIDIGSVDSIVQYNAPHSVASLGQRLGRSGRTTRENILHFIATDEWSLLQGLAAISLYEDGVIDRFDPIIKPYDVFAHQIISILLENTGMPFEDVKDIELVSKKIYVTRAVDGNPPMFSGGSGNITNEIRSRMKTILEDRSYWIDYSDNIKKVLLKLSKENLRYEKFQWTEENDKIGLRTFQSTKINRTLQLLLNMPGKVEITN